MFSFKSNLLCKNSEVKSNDPPQTERNRKNEDIFANFILPPTYILQRISEHAFVKETVLSSVESR